MNDNQWSVQRQLMTDVKKDFPVFVSICVYICEVFAFLQLLCTWSPGSHQPVLPRGGYMRSPSWTRCSRVEPPRERKHHSDSDTPDPLMKLERPKKPWYVMWHNRTAQTGRKPRGRLSQSWNATWPRRPPTPPLSATGHSLKFYGAKQTSSGWTLNNVLCGDDVEMCNSCVFFPSLFPLFLSLIDKHKSQNHSFSTQQVLDPVWAARKFETLFLNNRQGKKSAG